MSGSQVEKDVALMCLDILIVLLNYIRTPKSLLCQLPCNTPWPTQTSHPMLQEPATKSYRFGRKIKSTAAYLLALLQRSDFMSSHLGILKTCQQ